MGEWTVERALYTLPIRNIAILAGDFNIRHPSWDPNGRDNSIRAREFLDWIEKNDFLLRNVQGTPTFYRSHLTNPSVLDLTFTKGGLSRLDIGWATTEVGSDHSAILYRVVGRQDGQTQRVKERQTYDTKKADWELFRDTLLDREKEIEVTDNLNKLGEEFSTLIARACDRAIPKSRKTTKSKP